jgi:hypothetical protein
MAHPVRGRVFGYVLLGLLAVGVPTHARAEDRIGQLTATLASGHTERDRVAAVTSLARIEDKAALRPLVVALQDPSATVRGIACTGLGKLRHKAAAPALRMLAVEDADPTVRQRAVEALELINRANGLPAETIVPAVASPAGQARTAAIPASRPRIHVTIRSTTDEAPGKDDQRARKGHSEILRQTLTDELARSPLFTTDDEIARRQNLDACQIDISIVRLDTRTRGGVIEVEAQLRLTISDPHGKMLSFLSGGARMEVRRHGYNLAYLPQLRRETVANAVRGLSSKLVDHLRRTITS